MINSQTNENFKRWRELLSSRGIKKHGQFFIFGKKLVQEILDKSAAHVLEILLPADRDLPPPPSQKIRTFGLAGELFKELDIFGTGAEILVCRLPTIETWDPQSKPSGLELICPVGDPSNLGGLLRSALGLGASKIILLQEAAHPFHPKAMRALSSDPFQLPLAFGPDIKTLLNARPEGLIGLDMKGKNLPDFKWPSDVRLLVGEEGPGLPEEKYGFERVAIPVTSRVESLNAMVAASIAMYAFRAQHPAK